MSESRNTSDAEGRARRFAGVVSVVIAVRLVLMGIVAVAIAMSYPRGRLDATNYAHDAPRSLTVLEHALRSGWRDDATRMLDASRDGWSNAAHADIAPLYPVLIRGAHSLGAAGWIAGSLITLAALLAAALLLDACVRTIDERRASPDEGRTPWSARSILIWLVFPSAVALGWIVPVALAAALLALAWRLSLSGRAVTCGLVAGLAFLAHPAAIAALAFVFGSRAGIRRTIAGIIAGLAVAFAWPMLCAARFSDSLAMMDRARHDGWRITWLGPVDGIGHGVHAAWVGLVRLATEPMQIAPSTHERLGDAVSRGMLDLLALLAVAAMMVGAVCAWRTIGRSAGVACGLLVISSLTVTATTVPLQAAPRIALLALPAFVAIAGRLQRDDSFLTAVAASGTALGAVTWITALWIHVV